MLRFPQSYVQRSLFSTGVVGVTGAAPQQVNGNQLDSGLATVCLGARVYAKATTNTLTLSFKWQVLDDNGSTWIDVVESNNPSNVVLVTGTGAAVTVTKMISAPIGATAGSRFLRGVVISGTASGGGAGTDECSIAYDFRAPVSVYG